MSDIFTGTIQGRFVADGNDRFIPLRSDLDWLMVKNETVMNAGGANTGAEFFWQRGMTQGRGTIYTKTAATDALAVGQLGAAAGFYLVDKTLTDLGAAVATTGITADNPPVVTTGDTSGIVAGDVVRLYGNAGGRQVWGLDFSIDTIADNVSFELPFMAQIAAAAAVGTYRRVPYDPIFYPRTRTISNITQAAQAVVTLTVRHDYRVGQRVRFVIPSVTAAAYGMTQLDGVEATITAVNAGANTITVDVDTTAMTAFAFPLTADYPFTPAHVVPIGQNTPFSLAEGVNPHYVATKNTAELGIYLRAGANSPAGVNGDVIYWVAGKSM